jgi:hypothetical protein
MEKIIQYHTENCLVQTESTHSTLVLKDRTIVSKRHSLQQGQTHRLESRLGRLALMTLSAPEKEANIHRLTILR